MTIERVKNFDILQVSPDTDFLISNGYHNNLKMSQSCDILPKPQVQAFQFPLHISYFLQNCKKGKPGEMDLPLLKTISQPIEALPK
jgi:hypothetical protein